jgi:S-adenosylmethionine:tRNA ribosyltransferase-isomerase
LQHLHFREIGSFLHPGDLLVANESRVIPARLFGRKEPTGARVEMLLLNKRTDGAWEVLLKPGRRVRPGVRVRVDTPAELEQSPDPLMAEVVDVTPAGGRVVSFSRPVEPLLDRVGVVPLPPYIHTPLRDPERYQTVYARVRGSVAAPTAGLHFTPGLLSQLQGEGIEVAFVTLHVSMDTFRPVVEEDPTEHRMYSEQCELSAATAEAINRARSSCNRVIAVGTTSVRVLETAGKALDRSDGPLSPFVGPTSLFIYPGFEFRVVNALITNFHLPRSSLLMLVAAFAGKDKLDHAYQEAIRLRYRFFSFGDAMLID